MLVTSTRVKWVDAKFSLLWNVLFTFKYMEDMLRICPLVSRSWSLLTGQSIGANSFSWLGDGKCFVIAHEPATTRRHFNMAAQITRINMHTVDRG